MMILQSKDEMGQDVSPLLMLDFGAGSWRGARVERLEFALADIQSLGPVSACSMEGDHDANPTEEETQASLIDPIQSESERLAEEIKGALERGRVQGHDEARDNFERQLAEMRIRLLECCFDFQLKREGYFASVEEQVVKLALEIAKRVLHREVRVDPMVLQRVVHAALTKVMDESGTILRVPIDDAERWTELLRGHESFTVEVRGEARLSIGECILDTRVGRVELGVSAHMEEIEKGFSDLMQQRSV